MRLGAYDFIEKPLDSAALLKTVAKALEKQRLASENRQLRRRLQQRRGVEALIGDSPPMQAVKQLIRQIAPTDVNVLIQGESGTGKEIVADALHDLSGRRDRPFVKISCAAIPETLLESELFGHERGAFTGAAAARPGKFELADGGTLLLDEIAEMSPQLQAKLLRVLQDGTFSAARRDEGNPGQRAFALRHPRRHPAGRRGGKIPARFVLPDQHGADRAAAVARAARGHSAAGRAFPPTFLPPRWAKKFAPSRRAALDQLLAHAWPGNVRELNHVIQRAVALADGDTITSFAFAPGRRRRRRRRAQMDRAFPFPSARPWMKPRSGWCRRRLSTARATNSRPRGCSAFRRARCIGISQTRWNKRSTESATSHLVLENCRRRTIGFPFCQNGSGCAVILASRKRCAAGGKSLFLQNPATSAASKKFCRLARSLRFSMTR